jgi:hypothetical protein
MAGTFADGGSVDRERGRRDLNVFSTQLAINRRSQRVRSAASAPGYSVSRLGESFTGVEFQSLLRLMASRVKCSR